MSPQANLQLGAQAEAMLASWPAPSSDDAAWENRAAKIVAAATNAPRADDAEIAALFARPALEPEPGEVENSAAPVASARSASGEKAMSDSNSSSPSKTANSTPAPATGAVSKRPSLKELAARASQANAGAPSMRPNAPATVPPPAAESTAQDKQNRPSSPAPVVVAKASVPPARPVEATKDDSGRVDLNAINKAATPEQVAAAEAAKPAVHDLVADAGEDKPEPANDTTEGAKVKSIAEARTKKAKKKGEAAKTNEAVKATEAVPVAAVAKKDESEGGGKWVAILAILGIAAGGFFFLRNKSEPQKPVAAVVQEKPEAAQPAVDQQKIAEAPKPTSTGLSIDSLPTAAPAESVKAVPGPKVAAANTAEEAPPPLPTAELPVATALPTATAPNGKPGDLSSAMAEA
ncbi:MAG TPA: hypothetical protein PK156_24605, partial [Polyangium sp.]|nr:hypothetical protein [Polyangium sp.]